jgi:hypothetical protein
MNNRKHLCRLFFSNVLLLFCCSLSCFSQPGLLQEELLKLTKHSDSLINKCPAEKVYLQFDKPYYAVNDTIWFKAYLLNAPSLMFSAKSGLLHIGINSDSGKLIKQYLFIVKNGVARGNIVLDDKNFNTGTYTLRAYTNWMRNFDEDVFFNKSFYVANVSGNNWLITENTNISNNNLINSRLQFSNNDKVLLSNKSLNLSIMSGGKKLYKQKIQTDQNGLININFTAPEKTSGLTLVAESEQKDQKAVIPVNVNRPGRIDLQFLPEGGSLVAGLPARIGFKAVGEDGKGANISGIITDHNQQQVASFRSLHNGMGSFFLNALPGENYTAEITLPGGAIKEYPLPSVKNSGTILQVKNVMEGDSLEVVAAVTDDLTKSNTDYFLIGKARGGITCYAAIINFHDVNYIRRRIAKRLFPSGITHFMLMTAKAEPLNERLVYIDHNDDLHIKITPGEITYFPKDSIALNLSITDNTGKAVQGNFSLAVTDDTQVKTDSLNNENLITYMLLTSDLKGYIENPGYYFLSKDKKTWQALDNLMMTQGWVKYELSSSNIQYETEKEYKVQGSVSNVFNRPVKGTHVLLFSKSPSILMDTVTNKEGKFAFTDFPKVDTPVFVLKAVNKNGKSFNVGIKVNEIKPAVFINASMPAMIPWYVNSDTTMLNYAKINALSQFENGFLSGKHVIKEVKIVAKKTIKESQNLNGAGNADFVMDEKDLEKAGKKSFLQMLEENVKGFHVSYPPISETSFRDSSTVSLSGAWYYIGLKKVVFLVDGIILNSIYEPYTFEDVRDYLRFHDAEDIKGIEVMSTGKYLLYYKSRNYPSAPYDFFSFIEITTRSGHGPIIDNTPGMYLYKPLAISWPKQFYKPRYLVTDTAKHSPDLRSTIHWEPNIITDEYGKATVWFYAADKPATYTIITEGTDFNGNLGYRRQKVIINSKAVAAKSK